MRRTDLHVFVLRIIDFVLNPALQGPVVGRARSQMKDDHGPKSDERSEQINSHSALEWGLRLPGGLPAPVSQTRDNEHINASAQRESAASASQNLAN